MKNYKANEPCCACGHDVENEVCYHHVKHRSNYGGNEPHNLMPLCKKHHSMIHELNKTNMANRFPGVKDWFLKHGWYFCEHRDRWVRNA